MDKPIAWYDPSNGVVSTDQDCPLFTPLGQVWGLYAKEEAKDEPVVWGASSISKPEYIAEQKAKTSQLRNMMDEAVQTVPNFDQLQQIVNNLERCLTKDSKHEFLRVWIRDWTEHKLSKHTSAALEAKDEPEQMAKLGWQVIDCPICGGGARAFPKQEAKDEPVAWMYGCVGKGRMYAEELDDPAGWQPLYTTPPQRKPLTDEEINALDYSGTRIEFVRAIEAKLKEKNT